MIPVLLILVPLLAGLIAFFVKKEGSARAWALLTSLITLAVSLIGLAVMKDEKMLAARFEWMGSINSTFSVRLDGLGQVLCLLNAVSFPAIFIATWKTHYERPNNFFALMLLM